jgi:PilZ domain
MLHPGDLQRWLSSPRIYPDLLALRRQECSVDPIAPIEPPIDRQSDREQLFIKARCRTSRWHVVDASLSDISAHGCCIGTRTALTLGQAIEIRYGSNKGLPGNVRWVKGMNAGVEFDRPLDAGELELLLSEHRPGMANVTRLPIKAQASR